MIYLLAPSVTSSRSDAALRFCSSCEQSLRRYVPLAPLDNEAAVRIASAEANDSAIFFNPPDGVTLSKNVIKMLSAVPQAFPVRQNAPHSLRRATASRDVAEASQLY